MQHISIYPTWVYHFVRLNPHLVVGSSHHADSARTEGFTDGACGDLGG